MHVTSSPANASRIPTMPPIAPTPTTAIFSDPMCPSDHFAALQRGDVPVPVAELGQHLLRVLAQQRRALHLGDAVTQLDRIADSQVFTPRRVIYFHNGARRP